MKKTPNIDSTDKKFEEINLIDTLKSEGFSSDLNDTFKDFKIYEINDTIKVEFNGDNVKDFLYFLNSGDEKNIIILDGKTKLKTKIGDDQSFDKISKNFNWADYWGVTNDKQTFEVLVNESEVIGDTIIKLENKSIFIRKEEVGGGVITFKNGKYIWIHQSD
ncbi:hypothetical protein GCM10028861_21900 [Flavobacterium koreense]